MIVLIDFLILFSFSVIQAQQEELGDSRQFFSTAFFVQSLSALAPFYGWLSHSAYIGIQRFTPTPYPSLSVWPGLSTLERWQQVISMFQASLSPSQGVLEVLVDGTPLSDLLCTVLLEEANSSIYGICPLTQVHYINSKFMYENSNQN